MKKKLLTVFLVFVVATVTTTIAQPTQRQIMTG